MCLKDPGYDTDLHVAADIRCFVEAWRGFRDMREEIRKGVIRISGPEDMRDSLPDWLLLSGLAPYERKRAGPELKLSQTG